MGKKVSQKLIVFEPVFNRKSKLNAKGKAPIEIRAYQNRKRVFITTKIFVSPQQWDGKHNQVKSNHPLYDVHNRTIQNMIKSYEEMQYEKLKLGLTFSLADFKKESDINISDLSFSDFMDKQIEINSNNNRKRTKINHRNTLNHLKKFNNEKDIFFSDINYDFVEGFLNYLRSAGKAENTVHKQFKILKSYINIAIIKKLIKSENPCIHFKVSEVPVDREVLSYEELTKIEELDLSAFDKGLGYTRDIFLFACYTGLRISDMIEFKTGYVKSTKTGWVLDFRSQKESKIVDLELTHLFKKKESTKSRPELILEKYYNKSEERVFPKRTEQKINLDLKIIAALANINLNLSFKTARHTFGTYMSTKLQITLVKDMMQHSDIRTTMKYIHISREMIKQGLLKVDWD